MNVFKKTHKRKPLLLLCAMLLLSLSPANLFAHEPIFGLGPHVVFKGGFGIETEYAKELLAGVNELESTTSLRTEIMYGATGNLAVTLSAPTIFGHKTGNGTESSSGIGDISLRTKYRFWRDDKPGIQDAAAVIIGIKLPTGDYESTPPLGSGSTDVLFALAAARESRRWYYFGNVRYRLNSKGNTIRFGNRFFADAAFGVRPWLTEYLKPDLVVMVELNWEAMQPNKIDNQIVANSGGDQLFLSPGIFFTLRNWAIKGGLQIPLLQKLNGLQRETNYRYALAIELHV
ncbi:MAG: hypothetical protein GWP06_08405 [Actinobacteria bacterium]|nr:hypothetical protein [Actinomycetota bacterium]